MLFAGLLVLIPIVHAEILDEQGSLKGFLADTCRGCAYANVISHMTEGIARDNYNIYNPLDVQSEGFGHYTEIPEGAEGDAVLESWKNLFSLLIHHEWRLADQMLGSHLHEYPYELVHFQDNESGAEYYILRERLNDSYIDFNDIENPRDNEYGSFDYSWGVYVYAVNAEFPRITVQVIHPNDDYIAPYTAIDMFHTLGAGQLFFTTAGREVLWQGTIYTNAASLSDPSRNVRHVFQMAHEATTDYFMDEVPDVNPLMIQVHSYDTRNRNYPSAIVSAGYSDRRYSLPIYDWSGVVGGFIDRTPWIVQPADAIGNRDPVTLPEFYGSWAANPLIVYDNGGSPHEIPNPRDLVGYIQSNQLTYRSDEIDMCNDHEWFIHVEFDELPNCIEDSTEYDFYGGAGFPVGWNNFAAIVDYYHPFVQYLRATLEDMVLYVDDGFAMAPRDLAVGSVVQNRVNLGWTRGGDPNFDSYRIFYDTSSDVGPQSPYFDADDLANLCWQLTDRITITGLLYDQDYYFTMLARDRFGYESELTPVVMAHTQNTPRVLAPVGGEEWDYRTEYLVEWAGDGFEHGVWIEVNRNYPSGEWEVLAEDLADDGAEMVAMGDPLSDRCRIRVRTEDFQTYAVSTGNFSVISIWGYLQPELVEAPGVPLLNWNAGSLECPDDAGILLRVHNPGLTPIIIFAPTLASGACFNLENECLTQLILPAGTTDSCSVFVGFAGTDGGVQYDTLRFATDAINGFNNRFSMPLEATRTITIEAPNIVLSREGNDIRISWEPVLESIQGCPVNVLYRVWYYQSDWADRYFLGDIADTAFVHEGILESTSRLFYSVQVINNN